MRLEATTESSVVTYEVVITAYNPDMKLKPGLTANVTIFTLEKDNVLAIPAKALRFIPNDETLAGMGFSVSRESLENMEGYREVWVKNGETVSPRSVKSGVASGDKVEIVDGLEDGEEVVTGMEVVEKVKLPAMERSPFMPAGPGGNNNKETEQS